MYSEFMHLAECTLYSSLIEMDRWVHIALVCSHTITINDEVPSDRCELCAATLNAVYAVFDGAPE